jgi:hypothetical protein
MSARIALIALAFAISTPALAADCVEPRRPSALPDGRSATKDAMLSTKKQVDLFRREAEAYLECSKDERRAQVVHKELETIARRFNDEVRAFKAANPAS